MNVERNLQGAPQADGPTPGDAGHGGGTPSENNWLESLSTESTFEVEENGQKVAKPLSEHPALAKYKSVDELAKGLVNAQDSIGRKAQGLAALPEDASDEDKAQFETELRALVGVPETPEGYEIQMPDGMQADEKMLPWFKGVAHEAGLSPVQAQAVSDGYNKLLQEHQAGLQAEVDAEKDATDKELSELWGDKAPQHMELSKRAFGAVATAAGLSEDATKAFLSEFGDNAAMVRMFAHVGAGMSEDQFVTGNPKGSGGEKQTTEEFYKEMFGSKE